MWIRAALAYPASFWMLAVGGFLDHRARLRRHLDHVPHRRRRSAASACTRSPSCTAPPGSRFAVADLFVGRIERLGQMIRHRAARPMFAPAGAAADPGLRRRVRAAPASPGSRRPRWSSAWALHLRRLDAGQACSSRCPDARSRRSVIFFAVFIALRVHPVLDDRLHRGGQRLHLRRQHDHAVPAHGLPAARCVKALTFVLPLAFVNWYPSLLRPRQAGPARASRTGSQFASPVVAAVLVAGAPAGVAHRRPPLPLDGELTDAH